MSNSLIFIPDITGFTKFVNNTEISHSQHIISELLELIIANNQLGMNVAEIEGDAILFYKDEVPAVEDIVENSEQIFKAFHSHLKRYDTHRVCNCGACNSASNLSLKFVAHAGPIGFTIVQGKSKPFGSELVLAHRLLKNNLGLKEYLLMTSGLVNGASTKLNSDFIDGICTYEDIGDIDVYYSDFKPMLQQIPEDIPNNKQSFHHNPIFLNVDLPYDHKTAFNLVADLSLKVKWNPEIKNITLDKGNLNTIGTRHVCVFEKGTAHFETIKAENTGKKLIYGERLISKNIARNFVTYFSFESKGDHTACTVELDYQPLPVIGPIIDIVYRPLLKKMFNKSLQALKNVNLDEIYR